MIVEIQSNTKQIYNIYYYATVSNISAISWRPVLLVEEAGVHGENHRPWASNWLTLSLTAASRVHPHFSRYRRRTMTNKA
jgi:hypothetical protein